ncbi:MAG: hypothetical protein K2P57_11715 [Burkholderiales bacterium]|nr:hypothetical protein [Burkholderiales bacterium]
MSQHVIPDDLTTISFAGLRNAVLRMHEGSTALRKHREFVESGGRIRWVVDTDVVRLFMNPKDNARYANVFPVRTISEASPGLVSLASLLADFLFSKRFNLGGVVANSDGANWHCKLVLEPHTDELDGVIRGIARDAATDMHGARGAVAGKLEKEIRELLRSFATGGTEKWSNEEFVDKLLSTIERGIKSILPDGPFQELKRARDLLKDRKAIKYQVDVPELHTMISAEEFEEFVDDRTDIWLNRLRDMFFDKDRNLTEEEQKIHRPNAEDRNLRDARVLAKLDCLNRNEAEGTERYVMITGTGHLHRLVRETFKNRPSTVHLLEPSVFLGNPHLLEVEGVKPTEDHGSHWMRMTQAVNLLGTRFDSEQQEVKKNIVVLIDEWEALQRMALPYLPSQSTEKTLRAVAADIFKGKPLEALETQLYIALSDFFVVTAELGLLAHQDQAPATIKRRSPPLRMAFYPHAENFILALISRTIWNDEGSARVNVIANLIEAVKNEQREESKTEKGLSDFNYPLLLCLASRFAILGDWHASRVLAAHAKAVTNVTEQSLPFVTGREAALLESYSRRLEAKNADDLDRAREVLQEFRKAVDKEEDAWSNKQLRVTREEKCKLLRFNPQAEFPLHKLRADVDDLIIDFTESMFVCFVPNESFEGTTIRLRERQPQFTDMVNRSEACLARLDELGLYRPDTNHASRDILMSIEKFLHTQLELCALQCAIFLVAAQSDLRETELCTRWRDPGVWERVQGHDTVIAKIAALVACCVWGSKENAEQAVVNLESLGDGDLLPYDKFKHSFLKQFALAL